MLVVLVRVAEKKIQLDIVDTIVGAGEAFYPQHPDDALAYLDQVISSYLGRHLLPQPPQDPAELDRP